MPRSVNQKKKLAVLRELFLERTDALHPITMKEIIAALNAAGISAERKSIYNDIELLRELGTDIQTVRGKTTGYYLASREFELPELKLLADAVRASKFITEKKSAQLIKKLSNLANCHDRGSLKREVFVSNRVKSMNEDIYVTVDRIHEAIENDKRISFGYFQWTAEKKKELRRGGERYEVSPWALVWDDSNYYLVGFDSEHQAIRHYRVDKMISTKLCEAEREGREEFEAFDIRSYSGAVFGMFGGKPERVALSCTNRLANVMIDRFGQDTVILKESDERFRIHVNVVPSPVFLGWVLSFGGEVSIVSPESVAEKARCIAESNKKI
ncbi:MAG: WYL domain-containing transcriptional regulator [Clostridia bacterium]|nr:WYL domain-containing transcriptional regulator [Clostridia bacterium]